MSSLSAAQLSLLPLRLPVTKRNQQLSCFPNITRAKGKQGRSRNSGGALTCRAELPMPLADLAPNACAAYGVLLLGGGIIAYTRTKSKGSAIGGISGSALMAAAYYLMQLPETKVLGDAIGFGAALVFTSVFGIRLVTTRKIVPSGVLLGLSFATVAVLSSAYMADKASLGF